MMRRLWWALGLAMTLTPGVAAQDSAAAGVDSAERERLLQEIERRFGQVVQRQLGLTNQQASQLRAIEERFRVRRRALLRRQLLLRLGLQDQMRPGHAADPDSVRNLMDGIQANRLELVRLDQEQDAEMAEYLSPVQRAQYQMLRERLLRRLAEVRRERALERQERRPRAIPRRRPRP
jgi:Spy/CpxP family protein refolding chaperone